MKLINERFIPALDEVGDRFDRGAFFLPQLMASAEAARAGFDTIRAVMPAGEVCRQGRHRAGHGEGRHPRHRQEHRQDAARQLRLHGLRPWPRRRPAAILAPCASAASARGAVGLMTTTVEDHGGDHRASACEAPGVKMIVGGAVLTPEYASRSARTTTPRTPPSRRASPRRSSAERARSRRHAPPPRRPRALRPPGRAPAAGRAGRPRPVRKGAAPGGRPTLE